MLNVYIADDEVEVRTGLKKIIEWEALGFKICGEAGNGLTALNEIISLQPDLVLLDIRMPKLQGLEVASQLRKSNFNGHIIVLSGFSEFKYAQEAIKYDVDFYLTKPIEEDDLTQAVKSIGNEINKKKLDFEQQNYYQKQAKHKILIDLIKGKSPHLTETRIRELYLDADVYQILIIEYPDIDDGIKEFSDYLNIPKNSLHIEMFKEKDFGVILLKGSLVITKFAKLKNKNTLKDWVNMSLSEGGQVVDLNSISQSYDQALVVKECRFFMEKHHEIASMKDIPIRENNIHIKVNAKIISERLYEDITVLDVYKCSKTIKQLRDNIVNSQLDVKAIKGTLSAMYISLTNRLKTNYQNLDFKFITNEEIIKWMQEQILLEEIINFMYIESERVIKIIKGTTSDSIIDEISQYLNYHFKEDIKLKLVAKKFGYSSSYLGKLFRKKKEVSFNDYLHRVRIDHAKILLLDEQVKIYEVSGNVGYKNVDYFHLKFKELVGCTPNEYRADNLIKVIEE